MWRQRCCSYTVRCYDPDGDTRWTADYYRGAAELVLPDVDLSVCAIGDVVYVAGPLLTSSSSAAQWNLVRYDLQTGATLGRHHLTTSLAVSPHPPTDDIVDIAAGLDGTLGVLWAQPSGTVSDSQAFAQLDPGTLAELVGDSIAFHSSGWPFRRIEIDTAGDVHLGGEAEGRRGIAVEGTDEFRAAGQLGFPGLEWWYETGFLGRVPGPNLYPLVALHPSGHSGGQWLSSATRMQGTSSPDPVAILNDVAIVRDELGTALGAVTVGPGHVRGVNASAGVGSSFCAIATTGTIADQGWVGRFDLDGNFAKALTPTGLTTQATRVAASWGQGYYVLGGGAGRLYALDQSDAKRWTHKHHIPTDVYSTPAGECVTVGERSSRRGAGELDFVT